MIDRYSRRKNAQRYTKKLVRTTEFCILISVLFSGSIENIIAYNMAWVPLTSIDFSNKDLYNPVYIPLLRNKKRYIFLKWWSWSGKSTFEAEKEIIQTYIPWNRLLWLRKVKDTIKESVFAELVGIIEMWWLQDHFQITKSPMYIKNLKTWSDIIFRWMDDPEKVKSIRRISRIWIEEATEFNLEDFQQLDLRLRWQKNILRH